MTTLELLPIEGESQGEVIDVVVVDPKAKAIALATVRSGALAPLSAIDQGIAALKERHGATDYDITTPKGLALAKERRHAIRKARFQVPHIVKEQKAELDGISKAIESEGTRIVAALKAIEDPHDTLITAEETRLAEKKAKEQARVDTLTANLEKLRTTAQRAQGKASAEILAGIEQLRGYVIDESAWAEFAERANMAKATALDDLQALADNTKAAEDKAAEDERIRQVADAQALTLRQITELGTLVSSCFGKSAEHINAEADKLVEITMLDEDAPAELAAARANAITQLNQMATMAEQMEALKAAQTPAPASNPLPKRLDGDTPINDTQERSTFGEASTIHAPQPAGEHPVPTTSLVAANNAVRAEIAASSEPATICTPVVSSKPMATAQPAPRAVAATVAQPVARITLGQINERLSPIAVTAAGLAELGFTHTMEKASKQYPETDFPKICDALIERLNKAKSGNHIHAA